MSPLLLPLLSAALATGSPTLDEVIAHYVQARGGEAALASLQSVRRSGKEVWGGGGFSVEAEVIEVSRAGGFLREEDTLQGLTYVGAWDGRDAWSVDPFEGKRDPFLESADVARQRALAADLGGPLFHWKQKGYRVELLGRKDVEGTAAFELRVGLPGGDVMYVDLDPDRWLEIRRVLEHRVRGAVHVTETDLGDYGQVSGVWFPFQIDSGPKGKRHDDRLTWTSIEVGVAAPDGLFRFPAPGVRVERALFAGKIGAVDIVPPPLPEAAAEPAFDSTLVSGVGARNIGSAAMSGRISALDAFVDRGKTTLYVGAASGGVWKSEDGATTFKPVFDDQKVQSIGAIAVDPSDHRTVWVGTGEAWMRNTVSAGDGIYKSTDAGESWQRMGLPHSEHIARIAVDPKNGDTVYACVPGRLWSDSPDRGLYRTTDGGKSWRLVLKGQNLSTGCSGLAMDPANPKVLFAGLWDFRRKGWTFRSGGDGPEAPSGSGLYRSDDGGESWTALTAGLPAKPWGRVEVAVAPSNPRIVYALIEDPASALYRSSDGGATWQKRDQSQMMVWRPFYFARLVVDPTNPERLFKPDLNLIASDDGGKSFASASGGSHGDWHDLWIDPTNPAHLIGGDDGGLWLSQDGGNRWWKADNLPVSQFYHVAVDARDPYRVYGGLQDNGTWVGPSAYPGGISSATWENVFGDDGFWALPDPTDPDAVYAEGQGGLLTRVDLRTHVARDIQPKAGYHEKLRFNWNAPVQLSPSDPKTLYLGAQFLFRSRDRGDSWQRLSPDLTTDDPAKQKQEESGGVTVDNSSAEMHTTIFTISESPLDRRVIWVGTDDGNVQLTRDGGKHWANLTAKVSGLPPSAWVSWIEASRYEKGTAYAAFDRHTLGDRDPWVYRTADFGRHWQRLVSPTQGVRGWVHVVKEDVLDRDLLFVGTEYGLWISADGGKAWAQFKGGHFPAVAVDDLAIQPRESDLVLATHGRGLWIVDDITPWRRLTPGVLKRDVALLPGRPVQQRMSDESDRALGDAAFVGENPLEGAPVTCYLRRRHLYGPLKLEVLDAKGQVVKTLPADRRRGLGRVAWNMQLPPPRVPRAAAVAWSGSQGPRVLPGPYTVRLTEGTHVAVAPLPVALDRRAPYTLADRKAQLAAALAVRALFGRMSDAVDRIEAAARAAQAAAHALPKGDPRAAQLGERLRWLEGLRKKIVATKEGGAITGEERLREHADNLYRALLGWEGRPGRYQLDRIAVLGRELDDVVGELDAKEVPVAHARADLPAPEAVACFRSRGERCEGEPTAVAN
ncbi:MAG: WD40/YVTN/BNR-like repeat-containing protein [Myxococcales bacterium]